MEENEKSTLLISPDSPADESPEEGFIPYCGSEDAKAAERDPKIKIRILVILVAVLILVFVVSLAAKKNNYYHSVLNNLRFDYREGEATFDTVIDSPGSKARALSEQIAGQQIRVNTAMYLFDEQQKLQNIMTEYDYTHNATEDILDVRTGSENALFTKSFAYRRGSTGYQKRSGGVWEDDAEAYVPKLNEYFFGTESHAGMNFACQDSFFVEIGGKNYTCELWLMEDNSGSQTVYTTIYRYYNGSTLEGVRLLFDFDTLMEVYDIKNYTIG